MKASPVSTEPKTLTCALGQMWQTWVVTRAMASCLAATSSAVGDKARQKFTISAQAHIQQLNSMYVALWEPAHPGKLHPASLETTTVQVSPFINKLMCICTIE